MFCWATGAVLQCAIGNLHVAEIRLLRQYWSAWLQAGDVLLADRHYGSYVDLARLNAMGVFAVFRLHARRVADFRRGRRLGRDDQRVTWPRPAQWLASFGISRKQFQQLPETLEVRQIHITDVPRGFRSRTIVVVTTLLDPLLLWSASDRPNRVEPRRKKRRPKEYSPLNKPRHWCHVHGDKEAR